MVAFYMSEKMYRIFRTTFFFFSHANKSTNSYPLKCPLKMKFLLSFKMKILSFQSFKKFNFVLFYFVDMWALNFYCTDKRNELPNMFRSIANICYFGGVYLKFQSSQMSFISKDFLILHICPLNPLFLNLKI